MQIHWTDESLTTIAADLLAIAIPQDQLDMLEQLLGEDLAGEYLAAAQDFTGKTGQSLSWPSFGRLATARVMLVGIGDGDGLQRATGEVGKAARKQGAEHVVLHLPATAEVALAVESFAVGNYAFDRYKPETERKAAAAELLISGPAECALDAATAISGGRALARDLVNEPAAVIYPETLAQAALALAGDRLSVDIWDEARLREAGMGGILAVGQGSDRPPHMIHMVYRPEGEPRRKVGLVGKGVTFDAGGLSLKPTAGMMTMRCDMAGGAAVIGAMKAIAELAPDVEVHGVVGAVENMVNGSSYKLGDILQMYNRKTVEVHNTDAEGRLVLADCLSFACEQGVEELIDVATLTGACVVALGDHFTGLFTQDDALADSLLQTAQAAGERAWRLPMPDDYKEQLKASWGGIKNLGGRMGGAITAALFLSEFVDGPRWAHLDIAGPSFMEKGWRYLAPGGTGAMVPTLTRWACEG